MKTRLKNIGGICISCNCEVRDEDNWETENNADEHPDWGNIRCSECKSKWQFHNIGIGRAVIVADWERTGWRLFVFDPNRTDYGGLSDAELREELDSRDLDTVVTVAQFQAASGSRKQVCKQRLWENDGLYLSPEDYDINWVAPNEESIHDRLDGGYYLNDLPKEYLLENDFFAGGDCDLIIENAHLRLATETSLAQVYDADELRLLFGRMNGSLRIFEFPNTLTGRARFEAGIETSNKLPEGQKMTATERANAKMRDPEAILIFTLSRKSVLIRRFDPEPKIEVEDGLGQTKLAHTISRAAQHMNSIENHSVAEALGGEATRIFDELSDNSRQMISIEEIRRDYNRRLNPLRTVQYNPDRLTDELSSQISDALAILTERFGRMPEFSEEDLIGCANGDIAGLDIAPDEQVLLGAYRSLKTISWPDGHPERLSDERLKAQWAAEYQLLNEFVEVEREPFFHSKSDLETICEDNHIDIPIKDKEWFRQFLLENDILLEEIPGGRQSLAELRILCGENEISEQEYTDLATRENYGGLSDAELREELDSRDLDTVVTVAQAPAGPRRRVLKRRLLADDNQIEKRALAELLIQNNVDLETVPGDHLGKGQLQVICRENGLRDQSGYTVGEIVVLVPYSLRLGLQPGSLSGGTRSKPKPKMNAVMSLYCCVFDNNRRLRRNENTGDFISVDFIWSRLLLMSQYHGGASGIPRANLMWYVLTERFEGRRDGSLFTPRIQLGDDDSPAYIARQTARRNWRRAMKALIRIFRDAGLAREGAEGNEEE